MPGTLSAVVRAGCVAPFAVCCGTLLLRWPYVVYGGAFGAGEVSFYGKLFGGTRPVVVGGVKRFWDHNRYHISGFWPLNRYHDECPGH